MSPRTTPSASTADRSLRKRENTRARLVEAAADIVASKGIAGTRIDDVVRGAGFTRGAFYSNYSSLQEVLTEAIMLRANTLLETITEAIEAIEGEPTIDSLMVLLSTIHPEARMICLLTTEYSLHRLRHPESPKIPDVSRAEFTVRLARTVEDVLTRMGRRPTVPTATLAELVSLLFMDSITDEGTAAHLRELIEAVITGLSTPIISADA